MGLENNGESRNVARVDHNHDIVSSRPGTISFRLVLPKLRDGEGKTGGDQALAHRGTLTSGCNLLDLFLAGYEDCMGIHFIFIHISMRIQPRQG